MKRLTDSSIWELVLVFVITLVVLLFLTIWVNDVFEPDTWVWIVVLIVTTSTGITAWIGRTSSDGKLRRKTAEEETCFEDVIVSLVREELAACCEERAETTKIANLEMNPTSKTLLHESIARFSTELVIHCHLLAYKRNSDVVTKSDVAEALQETKASQQSRRNQLLLSFGGALFGGFISGFIDSLQKGAVLLIVIFVVMGFAGVSLVFLGYTQRP